MGTGLSISNNLLANSAQLHLDENQSDLSKLATQLSSGLRINTAADDPSGLAIATSLQTHVDGFNTAVANIQNASNATQVALGALTATTDILERIRSLAVEAASDINSNDDRQNLQAEISSLLTEINRISQNTNFNGETLLDGSHAGFQPQQNAYFTVTANASLATKLDQPTVGGVNSGTMSGIVCNFGQTQVESVRPSLHLHHELQTLG